MVDRTGGVAKIFIKRVVSNYYLFDESSEMIYLFDKFAGKTYIFVEIDSQTLAESRAEETLLCYETSVGSEDTQIVLFALGLESISQSISLFL